MSAFDDVRGLVPRQVWEGITARAVHGERLTLSVVELDPRAIAEEHSHDHEQLGIVLHGSIRFRVGDEERVLGPGETWKIPSSTLHRAEAGPDGATVLDLFAHRARNGKQVAQSNNPTRGTRSGALRKEPCRRGRRRHGSAFAVGSFR